MNEYGEAYWKLTQVMDKLQKLTGRIPSGLVGVAGECWVMNKLTECDYFFKPKLGRTKYDVELDNGKKLEVKTSNLKCDNLGKKYYAWIIQKEEKELAFDRLICVALPPDLQKEPVCYNFTKKEVERMPPIEKGRLLGNAYKAIMMTIVEDQRDSYTVYPDIPINKLDW